jgi:hypothetical protein
VSAIEVASVLRYSAPGILPAGVSAPAVEFQDGVVELSARVAIQAFPGLPTLDGILGILPDTVTISIAGAIAPLDDEYIALIVHGVYAAFIPVPLPDGMTPRILTALGRRGRDGLGRDALAFPLPNGVRSAHVLRDRLVLARGD